MTDHTAKEDMNVKNKNTEHAETNITKAEDANESSLREKFKEIVKEGSGLTFLKILVTALTAVSMSLLSANLTGVINSLILVALVSVGTAIVSEFYRILLSVTSLGAKKVVAPVIQVRTIKEGNTVRTITEEVVELDEKDVNDEDRETITEVEREESEENHRIQELEQEVIDTGRGRRRLVIAKVHQRFIEYFNKNPFMKFVVLFAGIAILTIGTSYLVSEKNQNTDNIFTTVYKTEKKQDTLSKTEKQAIIDEAVKQAQEKTPERTIVEKETEVQVPVDEEANGTSESNSDSSSSTSSDNNSDNASNGSNTNKTNTTTSNSTNEDATGTGTSADSSLSVDDVKDLEDRIKRLEEDNEALRKELTTLQNEQNASTNSGSSSNSITIEELEEQMRALQEQIDALSENSSTSQSTTQPSVSPNSAPQGTTID